MTIQDLLADLAERKISLGKEGTELIVRAKKGTVNPDLLNSIQKRKSELLALLGQAEREDLQSTGWAASLTETEIERVVETVAGGASNVQDICPLTALQEGILFHHLMASEGDTYLLPVLLSFASRGKLDAYLEALGKVIGRHDILRTAVVWEGLSQPVQVVWREAQLHVEEVELEEGTDAVEQMRERFDPRHFRIDIRKAPLLRGFIGRDRAKDRWLLRMMNHHLVMDHTTQEVVIEEVQAYLAGQEERLPATLPLRDYVAQSRLGVGQEEHEEYFRQLLGDVEEPTAPFGLLDVHGHGSQVEEWQHEVEKDLGRRLRKRAQALGVSVASVCHLAWAQLLARVSGRQDVVFGTVVFGRMGGGRGADRVLGLFINTLPVRIEVGREGVERSVQRVHWQLAELMRHEHAPLVLAQRCSGVRAPLPLFSALLNYRHSGKLEGERREAARVWEGVELLSAEDRTSYPFVLSIDDLGNQGFSLALQVQKPLEAERICGYMHEALRNVVEALEEAPGTPVQRIEVLPEAERRWVVENWNATEAAYPTGRSIHELFEDQVRQRPQAIAVVEGGSELTYVELNRRANQLAHYLRLKGLEPQERVAILLDRCVALVIAEMAILKCGAVYVPIDPGFPSPRQSLLICDCQARFLVCTSKTAVPEGLALTPIHIDDFTLAAQSSENLRLAVNGGAAAYVMYTSGSTGIPKGVIVPHLAIERLVRNAGYVQFLPTDCVAFASNPAFDASTMEVWGPLLNGGAIAIVPQTEKLESARFVRMLLEQQVTIFFMTTALFNHYAAVLPEAFRGRRAVLVGGDRVDVDAFRQVLSEGAPGRLIHVYGPTESTTFATAHEVRRIEEVAKNIPIGRPIGNTQVYILDAEGEPAPVGVAGELYIGGAGVAQGYLNRPELTAERFVPNPFSKRLGARLYKTGDVARWLKEGAVEFLGRNDQQIKVRGYRVELGEIEARLREHKGVREAVVVARGQGAADKRLIGYYTGTDGLSAEALRAHMAEALPEYMVPSAYVRLEVFPLTQNGKLDSRALPEPDSGAYAAAEYEPPQGEIERILAQIWQELLNVERVGRYDNFFDLGGHSLLTVKLLERMRQQGLQADVGSVFAAPTLAGLAAVVDGDGGVSIPANPITEECARITPEMLPLVKLTQLDIDRIVAIVPGGVGNVQDIYPLASLQEGILFHHLSLTEGDPYLLGSLIRFDSRERLDSYLSALQKVIDRHDILRTSILWEGLPEPVQVVWRKATLPVRELEVDPGQPDVALELRERFNSRRHRIDISQAPLLRAHIARDVHHGGWILMQLLHHLAGDHTTFEVMLEEIETHLLGKAATLPPPLPFRTLIAQTRLGKTREQHETYFRQLLAGIDEPTAPFGLLQVRGDGIEAEATIDVEPGLATRARERARQIGVSAASLFHVAWAQVLALVSGRHDVVFGTVLFGRMQSGTGSDRVMGLFINTLPVRIQVGKQKAADCVRSTHSQVVDLLGHEHASLALAQRCSAVPAPAPLFSALLNYRYGQPVIRNSEEARRVWEGTEYIYGEDRSNYPFSLDVDDLGAGFRLTSQVQHPADPGRVCEYVHRALSSLVQALESDPSIAIEDLEVLPEGELKQLLSEWNATGPERPANKTAHELFEDQVSRNPGAVAVTCEQQSLTYLDLNRRANQLAHYLRKLSVGPDVRVAICVERNFSMLVAVMAVLKAGGAYVPLDPSYPTERLHRILADSFPSVLLTQSSVLQEHSNLADNLPTLDVIDGIEEWKDEPDTNPNLADVRVTPEHLAYVIYTSGSTGSPRGVMIEHRGLCNQIAALQSRYRLSSADRVLQFASLAFDMSVEEIFGALGSGATLVLRTDRWSLGAKEFWARCEEQRLTVVNLPSSFWAQLTLDSYAEIPWSVRQIMVGGEAIDEKSLRSWLQREDYTPQLFNAYGPTEATVNAAIHEITPSSSSHQCIGRPTASTRLYILGGRGELLPAGVSGEICIGGVQVARGYLNLPGLTADRFVPDPFGREPGGRLYRTGDVGRWLPDGTIEFLGRNDQQVKIRGYRIEIGEIAECLGRHDGILKSAVVVREETPGEKYLAAYFTVRTDADPPGSEAMRAHLAKTLPERMIPREYVMLDALPLTPNGKLDRKALPEPQKARTRAIIAPRNALELRISSAWRQVLKVEHISVADDFFALGGHSLRAIQLLSLLNQAGLNLTMGELLSHTTVGDLALHIAGRNDGATRPAITHLREGGAQTPLFLIHEVSGEIFYGHQLIPYLAPGFPVYGLTSYELTEAPLRTMQGMAARLLSIIRRVQPLGPYRLAGYSFGGALAYEIATQLLGQDEQVEFLGLLDSGYSAGMTGDDQTNEPADSISQLVRFVQSAGQPAATLQEFTACAQTMEFDSLVRRGQELSLIPEYVTSHELQKYLARHSAHMAADNAYRGQPISIPVHLFMAQENAPEVPLRGWDALLPRDQISLISVLGDHGTMLGEPNVEVLAKALSAAMERARGNGARYAEASYSPVITIQAGQPGRAPLFCVPGAGDNVASFAELASSLRSLGPVYGLQPRGLDGMRVPHSTVTAAAHAYLPAIQQLGAGKPVHLLGHSFGGWVALEMASQLRSSGWPVASLTLIDTEVPGTEGVPYPEYTRAEAIMEMVAVYEMAAERSIGIVIQDVEALDTAAQVSLLHERLVQAGILPRSEARMLVGPLHTFETALRAQYQPTAPYTGLVNLALARRMNSNPETDEREFAERVSGWQLWAPNLNARRCSGNHVTVLKHPQVRSLSEWLRPVFAQVI